MIPLDADKKVKKAIRSHSSADEP